VANQDGPLVGREDELGSIEQALSRLQSGRPAVVEVTGEPGIGKTRLLDELTATARRYGYAVARGEGGELERDIPYGAVTDVVDPLLAELDSGLLRPGQVELARLGAVFPSLPGPRVDPGSLRGMERYRLFAAVRTVLAQLSRRRPLVVILDNVHWADDGSVELLGYLLRRPPPGPVLLTLAYRPRQVSVTLVSAIDATPAATRIALGPLSAAAVNRLLDLDGQALPASARAELYAFSSGNPFYLQALARSGRADLPAALGADLPERARRALQRELAALPAGDRELAELAAVVGDVVQSEILAAVAQVPEDQALATLDEMAARDLVRETELPGQLRFRHPVLRLVLYHSIPPGRRLAAHRRIAMVLQTRGGPLVERAYHVERSAIGADAAAAGLLAQAAGVTLARNPATAARWYAAALRLLPEHPEPAEGPEHHKDTCGTRLELLVAYAAALLTAGRLTEAVEVLGQARSLPAAADPAVDARLVVSMGQAYNLLGQHDRAADLMMTVLAALPDQGGRESVALRLELAQVAFWRGDYSVLLGFATQALAGTRCLGGDPLMVDAAVIRAFADYQLGRITSALGYLADASKTVDALPDEMLARQLAVLSHLGHTENVLGREDDALRHLDRGLAIAWRTANSYLVPLLRCNRTLSLLHLGRLSEAAAEATTALEAALAQGNDMFCTLALLGCTWVARDRGDPVAAVRYGEQALAAARGRSAMITAFAGLYLAEALHDLDAPERAVSVLLTAAGGFDLGLIEPPSRPRGYELLTRAELARGQLAAAQRYAELAVASPIAEAPRGRLHAQRARAAVAQARCRHHEAIAAATSSVTDAKAAGAPVETARSRLLLGCVQATAGHREQAVCTLAQAEADLAMLGVERERDLAAHELRVLGMRTPRRFRPVGSRPAAVPQLSPREGQVAQLVAAGHTNRQIATQLHITENTVETHLRRIFTKLKVSSRAAVATLTSAAGV
jgi:DNA-binding CsgD family transcriptional regulator/tetratricopeptide (TPR) repeat protein